MTEPADSYIPGSPFAIIFVIVLGAMLSFGTAVNTLTGMHEGGWAVCDERGIPDGVDQSLEYPATRSSFTFVPFGVVCGWAAAGGGEIIDYSPNVIPTLTFYGGVVTAIVGLVLAIRLSQQVKNG